MYADVADSPPVSHAVLPEIATPLCAVGARNCPAGRSLLDEVWNAHIVVSTDRYGEVSTSGLSTGLYGPVMLPAADGLLVTPPAR